MTRAVVVRALRDRLARRRLERQLDTPHYRAALSAGVDLRRERRGAIRRAERIALVAFAVAVGVSLVAIAAGVAVTGRMAGWW